MCCWYAIRLNTDWLVTKTYARSSGKFCAFLCITSIPRSALLSMFTYVFIRWPSESTRDSLKYNPFKLKATVDYFPEKWTILLQHQDLCKIQWEVLCHSFQCITSIARSALLSMFTYVFIRWPSESTRDSLKYNPFKLKATVDYFPEKWTILLQHQDLCKIQWEVLCHSFHT